MRGLPIVVAAIVLGSTGAVVAERESAGLGAAGALVSHRVSRAGTAIDVDGALDEMAWSGALSLELNYEVRPGENIEPPVRTICMVTFDEQNVYFGFRAYDPEPDRIRARLSDRDEAWSDDWVGVVLDTFNDERRAYELLSNPLGVQLDALNDDVGKNYDDSWNAIWKSAGRITEEGYEVEMAVPFHQIRFQAANGEPQVWGFDAIRSYPRSDRHHIGVFPRDRGNNSYLSQTIKLVGMEGASPGKNLEILPSVTSSRADTRDTLPDGDLRRGDYESDIGVTVRWGVTPNVSLNGALNPDFSQVEADALRLDINEQFALFFPETRPFFLEGADYFHTPLNLVHTRTVADPETAFKVTGKQGRHTYGVFSARDDVTNIIFPGAQSSDGGIFDVETTGSVGRYRFDFGRNSTVGMAMTDRRGGGYDNQVISADTTIRFTDADKVLLNVATSSTRYSDEMVASNGVRADSFDDHALAFNYAHSVRDWWFDLGYDDFGEGFRSDLGFRPQVGFRGGRAAGARVWWGEDGDFYNRMAWGGAVSHRQRQNGELLREEAESWFNMNLPKQSYASVNVRTRNRRFDGVDFEDLARIYARFETQVTGDLRVEVQTDIGDTIDFDNTQRAERRQVRPSVRYSFGRHLSLRYAHTYRVLDVEGGRLFRVHAPEARIVYQFNARAFVRSILQYTDVKRDVSLYEGEADPRTQDLFAQLLFTYKVNPQTALYLGYTDSYVGDQDYELTQAERTLFVKLGYAWVR